MFGLRNKNTRIVREFDYSPAAVLFVVLKRPSSKDIEQENLKTLSKNKTLTSIKGQNSVTNKQK